MNSQVFALTDLLSTGRTGLFLFPIILNWMLSFVRTCTNVFSARPANIYLCKRIS